MFCEEYTELYSKQYIPIKDNIQEIDFRNSRFISRIYFVKMPIEIFKKICYIKTTACGEVA